MSLLARSLLLLVMITACVASGRGQQSGAAQSPQPRIVTPPGAAQSRGARDEFSSQRGRFAILFPGTPAEEDTSFDLLGQRLESLQYTFVDSSSNFFVAYNDFPYDVEEKAETRNRVMNKMRDAGVSSHANGRVLSESEISLGRHPGRALKVSIAGGIIRVRMYAVGRRLYQVAVTTLTERSATDAGRSAEVAATKFLNSFRLIEPKAGVR